MKHSLKDGAGYLEIDHRDSPGLTPADVAHLPGAIAVPAGVLFKRDVKRCGHCQRDVVLEPLRVRSRGYCPKGNHYVCDSCEAIRAQTGACVPAVKVFDRAQEHLEKFAHHPDHPDAALAPHLLMTDAPRVTVPADTRPPLVLTDQ